MSTKKGRYGNPARRRMVAGDLQRLAQPTGNTNPRHLGGSIAGPGGPRDHGAVFLDLTDCVLLDGSTVCTVDNVRHGVTQGQAIYMTLKGRINKTQDRAQVGYIFGSDGAAALITQLLALADRWGPELLTDLVERLITLDREGDGSIAWLRAALDLAEEGR